MSITQDTMLFSLFILLLTASTALADGTKGCTTEEGKEVGVGEQHDVPGHCGLNRCADNNQWEVAACGFLGVPQGWSATPEDTSAGAKYPACCARLVAPLDIVPDVLDTLPGTRPVDIVYGEEVSVKVGNELTPTQVKSQPQVTFSWADPKRYYLLIMTDADAMGQVNVENHEFLHWMVGNIPGDKVQSGEVLAEYIGSGPSKGTGLHRYVFLVFKQPRKITFDEEKLDKSTIGWRMNFSTKKFIEKYNLASPEAINVYRAQYDEYSREIHKQIGYTDPSDD